MLFCSLNKMGLKSLMRVLDLCRGGVSKLMVVVIA
jgi:predicted ThiF/HesA family dinucleotide-utilizing enzyme